MACITESQDTKTFAAEQQPALMHASQKPRFLSDILASSEEDDLIDDLSLMLGPDLKQKAEKAKAKKAKAAAAKAAAEASLKPANPLAPIDFGYDVAPFDPATTTYTIYVDADDDADKLSSAENVSFKELEEVACIEHLKDEAPSHRMQLRHKRLTNLSAHKDSKDGKLSMLSLFDDDDLTCRMDAYASYAATAVKHVSLLGAPLYASQFFELPTKACLSPIAIATARATRRANKANDAVAALALTLSSGKAHGDAKATATTHSSTALATIDASDNVASSHACTDDCSQLTQRLDKLSHSQPDTYDYVYKAAELALCHMDCIYAVRLDDCSKVTAFSTLSAATATATATSAAALSFVGCASSESLSSERYCLEYVVMDDYAINCNDFTLAQTADVAYTAMPMHVYSSSDEANKAKAHSGGDDKVDIDTFARCHESIIAMQERKVQDYVDARAAVVAQCCAIESKTIADLNQLATHATAPRANDAQANEYEAGFRLDSPFYADKSATDCFHRAFIKAHGSSAYARLYRDHQESCSQELDAANACAAHSTIANGDRDSSVAGTQSAHTDAATATAELTSETSAQGHAHTHSAKTVLDKYETVAEKYRYQGKMRLNELRNDVNRKLSFHFGDDDLIINSSPLLAHECSEARSFRQAEQLSCETQEDGQQEADMSGNANATAKADEITKASNENKRFKTHYEVLLPFDVAILSQQFSANAFELIKDKSDLHGLSMIYSALRAEYKLKQQAEQTEQASDANTEDKAVAKTMAAAAVGAGADDSTDANAGANAAANAGAGTNTGANADANARARAAAFPSQCFRNLTELSEYIICVRSTAVRLSPKVFDNLFARISELNYSATHLMNPHGEELSVLIFDDHIEIVNGRYHCTTERRYVSCIKGRYRGIAFTYQSNSITPVHVLLGSLRPSPSNNNAYFINLIDDAYTLAELRASYGKQVRDAFIPLKDTDAEAFKQVSLAADAASSADDHRSKFGAAVQHQHAASTALVGANAATNVFTVDEATNIFTVDAANTAALAADVDAHVVAQASRKQSCKNGTVRTCSRRPAISMSFNPAARGWDAPHGYVTVVSEQAASLHETFTEYSYKSCGLSTELYNEPLPGHGDNKSQLVLCLGNSTRAAKSINQAKTNANANANAQAEAEAKAEALAHSQAANTLAMARAYGKGCAAAVQNSKQRMHELHDLALSAEFIANDMNYCNAAFGAMLCAPYFIASQGSLELCMSSKPMNNLIERFTSPKGRSKSKNLFKASKLSDTKLSLQNLNGRLFHAANAQKLCRNTTSEFVNRVVSPSVAIAAKNAMHRLSGDKCLLVDSSKGRYGAPASGNSSMMPQTMEPARSTSRLQMRNTTTVTAEVEEYAPCAMPQVGGSSVHTVYRYHDDPVDYAWSAPTPDFTSVDAMVKCKQTLAAVAAAERATADEIAKAHAALAKSKFNNTDYGACARASSNADYLTSRTINATDYIGDEQEDESILSPEWEKAVYAAETKAQAIAMYVEQLNASSESRKAQDDSALRAKVTTAIKAFKASTCSVARASSVDAESSSTAIDVVTVEPVTIDNENVYFDSVQMEDFSVVVPLTQTQLDEQAALNKSKASNNAYRSKVFSSNSLEALSNSSDSRKRGSSASKCFGNGNGNGKACKNATTRTYPFSVRIEGDDDVYAVEQKNTIYREHDDGVHPTLSDLVTASSHNARGKLYHKLKKHAEDNATSFLDGLGRAHSNKASSTANKSSLATAKSTEASSCAAKSTEASSCAAKAKSKNRKNEFQAQPLTKEELQNLSQMYFYDKSEEVYKGPSILAIEFMEHEQKTELKSCAIVSHKQSSTNNKTKSKFQQHLLDSSKLAMLGDYRLTFNYSLRSNIPDMDTFANSQETVKQVLVMHSDAHFHEHKHSHMGNNAISQTITKMLSAQWLHPDIEDITQRPILTITDVPVTVRHDNTTLHSTSTPSSVSRSTAIPVQDAIIIEDPAIELYASKDDAPAASSTSKTAILPAPTAATKPMSLEALAGITPSKPTRSKQQSSKPKRRTASSIEKEKAMANEQFESHYQLYDPMAYTRWGDYDRNYNACAGARNNAGCEGARNSTNSSTAARSMATNSPQLIDKQAQRPMVFDLEKLDLSKLKSPSHRAKAKKALAAVECALISHKTKSKKLEESSDRA